MSYLFKVWCVNRKKKASLVINQCDTMLSKLITKSNVKLGIAGTTLVMEKDGTLVDDNDVRQFYSGETFILLQTGETWSPQHETALLKMTSIDTLSVTSSLNDSPVLSSSSSQQYISSPTHTETMHLMKRHGGIFVYLGIL